MDYSVTMSPALLWLLSACVPQAELDLVEAALAERTAEVQACRDGDTERQEQAQQRVDELQQLQRSLQPLVERGVLTITVQDGVVTLVLAEEILFDPDTSWVSAYGAHFLRSLAHHLRRGDRRWQVTVWSDSAGEEPTPWHLALVRSLQVAEILSLHGVPQERLVAAAAVGTPRVEVLLWPDTRTLPGADALTEAGSP